MITKCSTGYVTKAQIRFAMFAATAVTVATAIARVYGAAVAFDSAADPAYNLQPGEASGWLQLSNGGFGFGPWVPASGNPVATNPAGMIGSSTTNGGGDLDNDGDINTPRNAGGRAWGLNTAAASDQGRPGTGVLRMFQGQLTVGQTFSVDFDNGVIADPVLSDGMRHPGQTLWGIRNAATLDGFDFIARADMPDYLFDGMDTGVPLTTEGVHCEFTFLQPRQVGSPPYPWRFTVTPLSPGGQPHILTGLWTTDIRFLPDEFAFAVAATGSDPANAVYVNNISISDVPEPGSFGPALVGTALLLRRRRRRRAAARRTATGRTGSDAAGRVATEADQGTGGQGDKETNTSGDKGGGSEIDHNSTAGDGSRPGFFAVGQPPAGRGVMAWVRVSSGGHLAGLPLASGNAGAIVTLEGGLPTLKIYTSTVWTGRRGEAGTHGEAVTR